MYSRLRDSRCGIDNDDNDNAGGDILHDIVIIPVRRVQKTATLETFVLGVFASCPLLLGVPCHLANGN